MFYTHALLGKHGILSKIWIAAHWQKKLTKSNIFQCNLETAIERILSPKIVISLRISGHLLLGVVRVYHRKTKYLLSDCNETLIKMQMTFCPGVLDLSVDNQEAAYNDITLREEFHDFDMQLPDLKSIDVVDHFTLNRSRVEDITMREEYIQPPILHESIGDLDPLRQDFTKDLSFEVSTSSFQPEHSSLPTNEDQVDFLVKDGFGDEGLAGESFADNPLFADSNYLGIDASKEVTLPVDLPEEQQLQTSLEDADQMPAANPETENDRTLHYNDEEGFLLEPLNVTGEYDIDMLRIEKRKRKKRKLMVDNVKEISSSVFREQLEDFSNSISPLDIAPSTHNMMEWKMTGEVEWLLSHPTQFVISAELLLECGYLQQDQDPVQLPEDNMEPVESAQASEEFRRNKRWQEMLQDLRRMKQSGVKTFSFQEMCRENKRKRVSTRFYSLLVLKNQGAVRTEQSSPYSDIIALPGPQFYTL
ncbi:double-strand-break repair protein rad21-like protein 1 [Gastrophryne carolinensis]